MIKKQLVVEQGWNFDNSYAKLPNTFYTSLNPTQVASPKLVIFNDALAAELGLNQQELEGKVGAEIFAGNIIPEGAAPLAQAYAGHQFGHFTRLGDGRAHLLGEHISPSGKRYDIQLKGSGRTPYSRGGDGRAVLGPMLREYIISEAMHALGIPTTRSLAVVTTGEEVIRETILPGAVLTRVAASHIRVGTFQYAAAWCSEDELRKLADYTIQRHYPELEGESESNRYRRLLQTVIQRQAELIAKWMQIGFIHGVMNTDNMTISGETIDYGPCAFMDIYDPATVFSSIDRDGRYAYGNQPYIGGWNLARFAETLLPLLHADENKAVEIAQDEISKFNELFSQNWTKGMRAKLGLYREETGDEALIEGILSLMKKHRADFTNTFRSLTYNLQSEAMFGSSDFGKWHEQWQTRLEKQQESKQDVQRLMRSVNPVVIPRNHRVEEALEAATNGDYNVMMKLLNVLTRPYEYIANHDEYCQLPAPSARPYQTFCGT
ncbi:protein adenylyltransferase SelO [Bacillus marasmi]|uniref:protein adenylyltransferase SelO n=1 Tax=Bacillus marasmi TaxID=1926279 RepID=UPI0011C781E5|nr:YdiU family protein [Bacillus marasmi]